MKNEVSSLGSTIKCLALGMAVGAAAAMVLTSCKATNKIKKAMECTGEKISSMFKMN